MNENFNEIEVIIDWLQLTIFPDKYYANSYQIFHYGANVDNIFTPISSRSELIIT